MAGKRSKEDPLAKEVDVLTAEFAQIKSLFVNLQTSEKRVSSGEALTLESPISEEDVMSVTASHSQFYED